jgi:copper chaperone
MQKTYRVVGMSCQGCVRSVTKAVQAAQPGAAISVDLAKGLVTVDAAGPDDGAVKKAVEEAGFEFEGAAG